MVWRPCQPHHPARFDLNAIQRIECGKRFVTDIELKAFAQILGITADELLNR